jgi:hypothetical protein
MESSDITTTNVTAQSPATNISLTPNLAQLFVKKTTMLSTTRRRETVHAPPPPASVVLALKHITKPLEMIALNNAI